ncbi:MAG TPA: hypothetical protein RMH99_15670 [Sandaracinaceae bacterium LLY-WYZ-13_1]|nr:hypothetical protein [Sandaracinaceae bacterium LLY-WYZ-13_1]
MDEEGDASLCPGGVCRSGRCDLEQWSRTMGGGPMDWAESVTMDALGNVYVLGLFEGSIDLGAGSMSAIDDSLDVFVASYGPDGAYRWATTFGSPGSDNALEIAYEASSDRIVFAVRSGQSIDFGGGPSSTTGSRITVVALESDGRYAWEFELPWYLAIGLCASNAIYVTGRFDASYDFGDGERSPRGGADGYIVSHASDGVFQRVHQLRARPGGTVQPIDIECGLPDDDLVVTGLASGDVDFGDGDVSNETTTAFATRFTSSLATDSTYIPSSETMSTQSVGYAITADSDGNVYVGGWFTGTIDFGGGGSVDATGAGFVVSLSDSMTYETVETWPGADDFRILSIQVDSGNRVIVGGAFEGSVNLGGGLRSAPPGGAAFIAEFDSSLTHRSDELLTLPGFPAVSCPSSSCESRVNDLDIGPADSTAVVGYFLGTVSIGGETRTSASGHDGFVYRLGD